MIGQDALIEAFIEKIGPLLGVFQSQPSNPLASSPNSFTMLKAFLFCVTTLLVGHTSLQAQSNTAEWFVGLNLPIPSFESNIGDATIGLPDAQFVAPHHVLRPGISIGRNGFAANLYLVAINPFISPDPNNTDYYLSPPGYEATFPFRYNLGYQHSFGVDQLNKVRPILGAFYGIGPRTNLEFTIGLRYQRYQFVMGVFLESNRHIIPIGDRWMETSVNFKFQYLLTRPEQEPYPLGLGR